MKVPQLTVRYGAFATKSLGGWPRYVRSELMEVIASRDKKFVLKSVTNGGNMDVLVMNDAKWRDEKWSVDRVADLAEGACSMHMNMHSHTHTHTITHTHARTHARLTEACTHPHGRIHALHEGLLAYAHAHGYAHAHA
eukprot:6182662-Pleurochrysis_carterae.AAC.1